MGKFNVVHYSVANEESVLGGERAVGSFRRPYGVVCTAEVSLFPVDPLPNY